MTQAFQDMMYLFSCGATGKNPKLEHELNFSEVFENSNIQAVFPIVFQALKKLVDDKNLGMNSEMFAKMRSLTLVHIMKYGQKLEFMHNVLEELSNNNIPCYILKGEAIAQFYNEPLTRISCDTDILIDASLEEKAKNTLRSRGFTITDRPDSSNHFKAYHPIGGLLEVHVSLFNEVINELWFDNSGNVTETPIHFKTADGVKLLTLGINDGLIFMMLHMTKHFLYQGTGIRQVMDLLLYMKNYKKQIDWDRINDLISKLKYEKFIAQIIGIGIKYFGFSKDELPKYSYDKKMMDCILDDIEKGGLFGQNEKERARFKHIYSSQKAAAESSSKYDSHAKLLGYTNYFSMMFPDIKTMSIKYPYLKKASILLPLFWGVRIIQLLFKVLGGKYSIHKYIKPSDNQNKETVNARMELIRELGMV